MKADLNKIMKIIIRLIYILQAPLFVAYMLLPFLWIIDIPYWAITNRNLMMDWCKFNGI